jgi:hypothetical protein
VKEINSRFKGAMCEAPAMLNVVFEGRVVWSCVCMEQQEKKIRDFAVYKAFSANIPFSDVGN